MVSRGARAAAGAVLGFAVLGGTAFAQDAVSTAPAPPPPGASADALADIRREIEALKAESAAAKNPPGERADGQGAL